MRQLGFTIKVATVCNIPHYPIEYFNIEDINIIINLLQRDKWFHSFIDESHRNFKLFRNIIFHNANKNFPYNNKTSHKKLSSNDYSNCVLIKDNKKINNKHLDCNVIIDYGLNTSNKFKKDKANDITKNNSVTKNISNKCDININVCNDIKLNINKKSKFKHINITSCNINANENNNKKYIHKKLKFNLHNYNDFIEDLNELEDIFESDIVEEEICSTDKSITSVIYNTDKDNDFINFIYLFKQSLVTLFNDVDISNIQIVSDNFLFNFIYGKNYNIINAKELLDKIKNKNYSTQLLNLSKAYCLNELLNTILTLKFNIDSLSQQNKKTMFNI